VTCSGENGARDVLGPQHAQTHASRAKSEACRATEAAASWDVSRSVVVVSPPCLCRNLALALLEI